MPAQSAAEPTNEFTIDELARAAGTTVRNVRAYQDRGLVPPPAKRGRTGIYTGIHLARLRIIGELLARGYTLANIGELLAAWERGHDVRQLLGLEAAITSPWSGEVATYVTVEELVELFGGDTDVTALAQAGELGILVPVEDGRFRADSPKMLHAGAELVRAGIPLGKMLDMVGMLRANVDRVAEGLVRLVVEHVFDPLGRDSLPPSAEVPRLAELVWRLRPLAEMAISSEASRALEKAASKFLGDRLAAVYEHLRDAERPAEKKSRAR